MTYNCKIHGTLNSEWCDGCGVKLDSLTSAFEVTFYYDSDEVDLDTLTLCEDCKDIELVNTVQDCVDVVVIKL